METFRFFLGGKIFLSLSLFIQSHFIWRVIDYSLVSPDLWTVWSKAGFLNKLLFPNFFGFQVFHLGAIYLTGRKGDKQSPRNESHGIGVNREASGLCWPIMEVLPGPRSSGSEKWT